MSPLNFGATRTNSILKKGIIPYVPVIPTTNLYAHWDMSLLSYSSGTNFTSFTNLAGTSGTSIGASANTPALSINFGTSGNPISKPGVVTAALSNKKAFWLPNSFLSGTANYGTWLRSSSPAFPDGLSNWTYIVVWSTTSTNTGWQRPYRWDIPSTFFYDDQHSSTWWWRSGFNGEVNIANAGTGQVFSSDGSTNRAFNSNIHVDIVTQSSGSLPTVRAWSNSSNGTINGGLNLPILNWSTTTTTGNESNRIFEVRPVTYTSNVNYPQISFYEAASYTGVLSDATIISTITALWNKWRIA